jgi:hypothetical protein
MSGAMGLWLVGGALASPGRPFVGDFEPRTVDDLVAFCAAHDTLTGDLRIGPAFPDADLHALSCLRRLDGALWVEGAPLLRALDGLRGLDPSLPLRRLVVRDNPQLRSVALPGPSGVVDVEIHGNPQLEAVAGLPPQLTGGRFVVTANPQLTRLDGPRARRPHTAIDTLTVADNARLQVISGFPQVESVRALTLDALPALSAWSGPPRLRRAHTVVITGLPQLATLAPLAFLEAADHVSLGGLDALRALPPLPSLGTLGTLTLRGLPALEDTEGLFANRTATPLVGALAVDACPGLRSPAPLARRLGGVVVAPQVPPEAGRATPAP